MNRKSSAGAGFLFCAVLAYRPILSSSLSALGSLETPMVIVSAAPHVTALVICAVLFRLLARSLGCRRSWSGLGAG